LQKPVLRRAKRTFPSDRKQTLAESDKKVVGFSSPVTSHSNEEQEWLSTWKEVRAGKLKVEKINF